MFDREQGVGDRLIARWLFLRALGVIYFAAFLALVFQARGLIGTAGILPAQAYLQSLHGAGVLRFWYAPSLLWISSGNGMLMALIWLGLAASLLLVCNVAPRSMLLVCFVCFLSFVGVSQDFGAYQSDGMLLEAGLLSLFVAPSGLLPGLGARSLPSRAAVFLLLWEWFRIYFESGVVKIQSGDPTWRNLTAMYEYYQNGPLPTWVGWYLQHLPHWFHIGTAGLTLVMEFALVWMAFLPRPFRIACFVIVTVWQAGVIATANYAFLNYLVLVLAVFLLDDALLRRWVPARFRTGLPSAESDARLRDESATQQSHQAHPLGLRRGAAVLGTAVVLTWVGYNTTAQLIRMLLPDVPLPQAPIAALEPFRVANSYGLFANMTPHRYEIEFQGSNDGTTWQSYEFRFKPQEVNARPPIYAPYQPRFDWNLWFASLSTWQQEPIVPLTEERLLDGDRDVLSLFRSSPFSPRQPPRYVRAVIWQYWFSTPVQKRLTDVWWTRALLGTYAPTITKTQGGRYAAVDAPTWTGAVEDRPVP
ncbi:lipase maturation factor family protein [Terriglobus aquaticus]|uniref:Lipase maturation factor family protein n=2 Tax=Terriglobus aquaticus TaxID=940139 RepID=A0ABW9KQB0_9BACT